MPRILCLTSHDPGGPDHGAILRARHVFKLLSRLGEVRVVLAGYHVEWKNPGPVCGGFELLRAVRFEPSKQKTLFNRFQHELNPRFMSTDWVQARAEDQAWLAETIAQHDLVWIHGVHIANGFGRWHWPNSVLDIDDIPSSFHRSKLAQAKNLKQQIGLRRQIFLWGRHERTLAERFNALCVCSEPDRELLQHPEKTFVVPNGFAQPVNPPARVPANPPRIGFVGNFTYPPNLEGAHWFVNEVWPLILKKYPQARLRLVGSRSDQENWPSNQNIEALGWVRDTPTEIAGWSLTVVPILTGGGTRVKIAEAFSRRCPIVATSLGAYGYGARDGEELLLADDAPKFADQCSRILAEPDLGGRLAEQAWKKFEANWTWDAQAGRVATVVNTVLKTRSNGAGSR